MRLAITPRARQALAELQEHISRDSPRAAETVADRILQTADLLTQFPRMGRVGALPDTYEFVVPNVSYRLIYRLDGDLLRLLDVVHTRRQWPPEGA